MKLPAQLDRLLGNEPPVVSATALVRCLVAILLGLIVTAQSDGQLFRRASKSTIPVQFNQLPTQQQLLDSLNARSAAARQLNSRVTISMPGAPKIKGTLQVEFPDRLRLKAGVLGSSELGVDVGSNAKEFWIWSKAQLPGQPPAFYHADHLAFSRSPIRQSIPLEPKWLIEAIGLPNFSPTDTHYGPTQAPGGRMKLFTVHQTPSGPQTRVTLLSTATGLVQQQAMYDANNTLIAYTNTTNYKNYPEENISLPQTVELHVPQPNGQTVKIEIGLGSYSINALYGDPNKMWARPVPPAGVRTIDLTQVSNPNQVPNQNQRAIQPPPNQLPSGGSGYQRRFLPPAQPASGGFR